MKITSSFMRWLGAAVSLLAGVAAAHADSASRRATYAFSEIGIKAGLPSNVARLAYQAGDGYLWIGTEGGLARFDGVRLTVYRHATTPGLPDNQIRDIHEGADGVLWIATQGGLTRYHEGRFESVPAFAGTIVSALAGDAAGKVWIGTQSAGLWSYAEGRYTRMSDPKVLPPGALLQSLTVDSTGAVWVGLVDGGVVRVKDGQFEQPTWGTRARISEVNAIVEQPLGTLWFATARGLHRLTDGELQPQGGPQFPSSEVVHDLFPDGDGRLWAAAHGTLWVKERGQAEFTEIKVAGTKFVRAITQDREGSYWIETAGDGIIRMRPSAFRMAYTPRSPDENLRSVATDSGGNLWVGMAGRGLVRIGLDGTMTDYPLPPGVDSDVGSVLCAQDGAVWFGTRGSTGRWVDGRIEMFPEVRNVRALFQDRAGTVWCAPLNRAVHRFERGKFVPVGSLDTATLRSATCFTESRDGSVYIGFSLGGVVRWRNGVQEIYDAKQGIPDPEVRTLYLDRDDNLWVGSKRRALAVKTTDGWHTSPVLAEILTDLVTAIAEDGSGNLWLGTPKGLVWAPKSALLAAARGERLSPEYHLVGDGEGVPQGLIGYGTQPSWAQTAAGELCFISRSGLLAVRPAQIATNPVPPPVAIEQLTVDGQTVPLTPRVVLPPGTRSIAIDYTALSFVQPGRVAFRYQLVGIDHEWVDAGSRRTAYYTNLTPGAYTFRVVAANENGVSNPAGASLPFLQQPWFYQTWWFYVVAIAGASAAVAGMYLWRTAGLRRQVKEQTDLIRVQLETEAGLQAELERSSRLESLGLLAGGIAHDFNNLLTAIMGNLGLISLDQPAMKRVGDQVRAADGATKRARDITQQLLTFAKGGDPVRAAVALPDVVREAAGFVSHGSNVRIEFDIAPFLPPADVDAGQISRVVHNLVLNALQAMPGGGVIRIAVSSAGVMAQQIAGLAPGAYLKIAVADSGRGIEADKLTRIFDPYFSTKSGNSGLGLATVRSIVRKHQGQVEVSSVLGQGSVFTLWLPAATGNLAPFARPQTEPKTPGRPLRVLFMDDEEVIRDFARQLLEREGHEGIFVAEGGEAVRVYREARGAGKPFDVVVLDLTVPGGVGGKEVIESLRQMDPNVRAIASSGYSSDPVMASFRTYGFTAVVPKPYDLTAFVTVLNEVGRDPSVENSLPVGKPFA